MGTVQENIRNVVQKHQETLYETCQNVLEYIIAQEKDNQHAYFNAFLKDITLGDIEPTTDMEIYFSKEVLEHITVDIDNLCERIIENLVQQNVEETAFYQNLWGKMSDLALLPNRETQIAFMMRLWVDPRIPYYHIDIGRKMDNKTFACIREKILPQIRKANFILAVKFEQKTQRASLLMSLADSLKEDDEKLVYWAIIISRLMQTQLVNPINNSKGEIESKR